MSTPERLRVGLWDVYAELGFDTDGDDHYHGSDEALISLVKRAAREHRAEAESEYDLLHDFACRLAQEVPEAWHRDIRDECRFHRIPL